MAIKIISGTQIQSSSVDDSKTYVDGRDIANLGAVGAIDQRERDVLDRVDTVLMHQPANGKPEIDEMVAAETAPLAAAFFPEERSMLAKAWRVLEWREVDPALPAPMFGSLADEVKDTSTLAAPLNYEMQLPLTALEPEDQQAARRLQLVLNGDQDAKTISLVDLRLAIADYRFTPADQQNFARMQVFIERLVRSQPPVMRAVVEVPPLGRQTVRLPGASSVAFSLESLTTMREDRRYGSVGGCNPRAAENLTVEVRLDRERALLADVPLGCQAIVINLASGAERLVGSGRTEIDLPAGTYRVELWRDGGAIEHANVEIPAFHRQDSLVTSGLADHAIESGGAPLARVLVDELAFPFQGRTLISRRFEYGTEAVPFPGPALYDAELGTPIFRSGPGTYPLSVPGLGDVLLDVFPEGAVHARMGGRTFLGVPTIDAADGGVPFRCWRLDIAGRALLLTPSGAAYFSQRTGAGQTRWDFLFVGESGRVG